MAAGYGALLSDYPGRELTRRYAEQFSWHETSVGQIALFKRVLGMS